MKAIDVVKIGRVMLEILSKADIKTQDYKFVQLYEDYLELRKKGCKYDYTVAVLSQRYRVSQSTVSRVIRRLGKAV